MSFETTERAGGTETMAVGPEATGEAPWHSPDWRRVLQLALATVWLLDGVLQLQPVMFTPGPNGFSGMLSRVAAGNPHVVARTITWNASIVDHHALATDSVFALIQLLIGIGIAWRPTVKPALGASIIWSLAVWWFGEGLGGILHGAGTPIGGGPGAVLIYALLAIVLWPTDREDRAPFAAARAVGTTAARALWLVLWVGMAVLSLLGAGRSPQGTRDLITGLVAGQPAWLAAVDRDTASAVENHGLALAVVLATLCLLVAVGAFLSPRWTRLTLVLAIVGSGVIWVFGQNFGTILAGGATDPNSGPLLILLALAYWPHRDPAGPLRASPGERAAGSLPVGAA